ncbi:hypothetical protein MMC07_007734 [Pseudocyphellaria aurata]|nr:hypothetical protein [Pseudocyphellaria aurata]
MVNTIHRVGNDRRMEWTTVNSSFGHWQPPKEPQSLPYSFGPYEDDIGPNLQNEYARSYITQLPVNHIQTPFNGVSHEGIDFFAGSNGLTPVQQPGTCPVVCPENYDGSSNAFWNLPQLESLDQTHDTGSQPDVPYLEDGNPDIGATAQQERDDAHRTTSPLMSDEEFAQSMAAYLAALNDSRPSLGTIAQPQPGNGEPYVNQDLRALPISCCDPLTFVRPVASVEHRFGILPGLEPPNLIASSPNLPHRTPPSPVPTWVARRPADQDRICHGPMIQTLDLHMNPTKPRKRRCFSESEKKQINQCEHVAPTPAELPAASPDSNGPETPFSDIVEDVQILSPS